MPYIQSMEKALLAAKDEPILYPKHLPMHIRIQVAPTLKEFRETIVFEGEQRYFKDPVSLVNGNIDEACRISGLSRSRLYTLLKKYRLSPPLIRG